MMLVQSYFVNLAYLFLRVLVFGTLSVFAWWFIDRLTPIPMRERMEEGHLGSWVLFAFLLVAIALLVRI